MAKVIRLKIGDQEHSAIEQPFEIAKEDWNEYRLLDGGTVRVLTNVQKIFRILDDAGKPVTTAEGEPFLFVRHVTQVVASE